MAEAFVASLSAMKIDSEFVDINQTGTARYLTRAEPNQGTAPAYTFSHEPYLVTSPSRARAQQAALEEAARRWPESEGYFGHHAVLHGIERDQVELILGEL
ncbi:MAG TPA: hypothetical protein VFZ44_09880 [Pyrinomonadaceae bacterium]